MMNNKKVCEKCSQVIGHDERYNENKNFSNGEMTVSLQCLRCRPNNNLDYKRPEYQGQEMAGFTRINRNGRGEDPCIFISNDGERWEIKGSDLDELSRRVVECSSWEWLPGMKTVCGKRIISKDTTVRINDSGELVKCRIPHNARPDLEDHATNGCIIYLVRSSFGYCGISTERNGRRWSISVPGGTPFVSEVSSMVAVLERLDLNP